MQSNTKTKRSKRSRTGLWVILVAAIVLEAVSSLQYFYSRAGLRAEAERRAQSELRRAELEINVVTAQHEAAVRMLAMLVERNLNNADSVFSATRTVLECLDNVNNVCVGFVPDYFPKYGRWFEPYSSRETKDGEEYIYTHQIGGENHDYLQMEWFSNGMTIDSTWWSEPYYDDSGAREMVVSCSYPIHNPKGEIVAVALVDLSLEYLQNISEYLQVYAESSYSIVSNRGLDIVPPPDTLPGRKYHIFREEIDATGWYISIIIPDEVIYADLNHIGEIVGLLMLIGLMLLLLIVWYAGRSNKRLLEYTAKNQRMESELRIGSAIQNAMLPKVFPPFNDRLDLDVYGKVNPAKEVGGDLYDFYVREDKLFFCIGDVSGKGVPAALIMAMTRALFRSITAHADNAAVIVSELNSSFTEQNTQNMFLTLFLGVLDCKTGVLNYCNAGHNAPTLNNKLLPVVPNLPIGIIGDFEYQAQSTQMSYDDLLFLYTDGLTEAENIKHQQYGEERMLQTLSGINNNRPREVMDIMQSSVESFVDGAEQSDDLTMFAIRYQIPAIVMRNDIQQIPTLAEWIDGLGIPTELNMPVNLALEEVVANVMLYAYPKENSGKVFVEFTKLSIFDSQTSLIFTVSDSGVPFDPTSQPPADTTLSAEDRSIGGLGIHLVRQLMDEITYRREDDKNILTLIKKI